jgi:hypothetical protein
MEPSSTEGGKLPAWLVKEPPLNDQERALRDQFVEEFMFDNDGVKACLRLGFSISFAEQYSLTFLSESYVQQRIRARTFTQPLDPERQRANDELQLRASLMKWANCDHGPTAVAAARQLCAMYGFDNKTREEDDEAALGGVMVVPGIASVEEWEKTAIVSQQKLSEVAQADVR